MNWAIGLWAAYGIFTVLLFAGAWWGISYAQKALTSSTTDEKE